MFYNMVYLKSRSQEIEIPGENPFVNDKLDRVGLCNILTDVVSFYGQSGCVMGLDGEWGSGKTTFVKMWSQHLKNNGYKTLYFNAWISDYTEDPLMALISELRELSTDTDTINEIATGAVRIGLSALKGMLKNTTGVDCDAIHNAIDETFNIGKEYLKKYSEQKTTLDDFKKNIQKFVADNAGEHPVIFFVDELDRCNPRYAVAVLERIKHLFEIPNIIFILAINKRELSNAIQGYYGSSKIDSDEYLRRFIDIDYKLPKPPIRAYCDFLFEEYRFDEFFKSTQRLMHFRTDNEDETFKSLALSMCEAMNVNLRQMDRVFAYSRLALMQFASNTYLLPDVYFMLCFWKVTDASFYNQISDKAYTVQELLSKLEEKLPVSLFQNEHHYYTRNIVFAIACLLYCYDITGPENYPIRRTLKSVKNETTGKNEFNIQSKSINKETLDDAFNWYYQGYSKNTQYGLRFILQRIDLLHSFSS